jgi:hypothetical protein
MDDVATSRSAVANASSTAVSSATSARRATHRTQFELPLP